MLMWLLVVLLLLLLMPLCEHLDAVVLLRFREEPTRAALVRSSLPLLAFGDCLFCLFV